MSNPKMTTHKDYISSQVNGTVFLYLTSLKLFFVHAELWATLKNDSGDDRDLNVPAERRRLQCSDWKAPCFNQADKSRLYGELETFSGKIENEHTYELKDHALLPDHGRSAF